MDLFEFRKQMIHSKVISSNITDNERKQRRVTGVIIQFQPNDVELEEGLKRIKDAQKRYIVKSLEGFTFKTFREIRERGI